MARPLLRAVQCARAWHDLTLHTADVEIAHALILTQIRPGSRVRGHPACWVVEVRNLPVATKLFGVFDGFKGCAAGFEASNPVSLPRACPCSARACLDPLSLDSVGCCGSQ